MPRIELYTRINAPIGKVFDLARSIDLHLRSTAQTGERVVAGRASGLIELGETVTWEARHLGVRQRLTSAITDLVYPSFFADEMVKGAFKSFRHEHFFEVDGSGTLMRDVFVFVSPFGVVGRLFNWLVLTAYMRRFLVERNGVIKMEAERG